MRYIIDYCSRIVFVGYKKIVLKSAEHSRRYQNQAPDVIINGDANITVSQRAISGEFE